jgi:hypothetical protein
MPGTWADHNERHLLGVFRRRRGIRPLHRVSFGSVAGLSYDTKFDLKQTIDLPYTTEWFSVPPAAPHGQSPKLGTLHPSLVRALSGDIR